MRDDALPALYSSSEDGSNMRILAINSNHDGAVAIVNDGKLLAYVEAQKDNRVRYSHLTEDCITKALRYLDGDPDVFAVSGWHGQDSGYYGETESVILTEPVQFRVEELERFWSYEPGSWLARRSRERPLKLQRVSSSHERTHIFCAYGLSPFEQGHPCYVLVWEGSIGAFYSIDEQCNITRIARPLDQPGHRYALLFELAHRDFPANSFGWSSEVAGKLMALACLQPDSPLTLEEKELMAVLLGSFDQGSVSKGKLSHLPFWNCGHLDDRFRRFASEFSARLFDRFYSVAKTELRNGWPLLIAGGCGLNCDWNSKWRDCGLFEEVFVPPCPDDSGSALGVAVDAQRHFTGLAKLSWDVYAGEEFLDDAPIPEPFEQIPFDYDLVAQLLRDGAVIAWVQGRYEIGPRALGNRSILAAPFSRETTDRLNWIKQREHYRPVAPVCLESEVSRWFEWSGASPHMLYFQNVRSSELRAVTHEDNSARVQTVSPDQNLPLYDLLTAFAKLTGFGVLCNTSLNFPGSGFINRASDLGRFVLERDLDAVVVSDRLYCRRPS
jgi:predicted NodU family carbamoyl transferase